jgi:hypothetical protein
MIFMAPKTMENEPIEFTSSSNNKLIQLFSGGDIGTLLEAGGPGNTADLFIGKNFHDYYDYIFSKNEFVITPADNKIKFSLRTNLKNHTFNIRDYCCTKPENLLSVTITKPAANPIHIADIEFSFKYQAGLLVLIGLFITATDNETGETETILCDPQVGSGPP